jgi:mitochondrial fission protein ELM1
MRILILSDGIPGHFNQSIGISKILSEEFEVVYEVVESKLKYNALRSIIMQLQKLFVINLNLFKANLILSFFYDIDLDKFDLIISTGKKVAYQSAALSLISGKKNIHAGTIKIIDKKFYTAHITGLADRQSPNNIVTPIPPTKYKPINYVNNKDNKLSLFLIGGDGAGYSYDLNDWAMLAKNIELLFKKDNIKPIIVTSRRTDKAHEKYLFNKLVHICSTDSIWFHKESTSLDLEKIFNKVSLIFVTEESATMTAEAISSGLPTSTLYPHKHDQKNEFYDHLIKYEKMRYIKRLNFKDDLTSHNYDTLLSDKIIQIRSDLRRNILEKINI